MDQKVVETIEEKIGYVFRSKALLEQAFTRKSYANEEGCPDNELLEFIGDEVLDLTITRFLLRFFTNRNSQGELTAFVNEGGLSKIKQQYVDSEALSNYMDDLGLAQYLRMGQSDVSKHVEKSQSVKEDLYEAIIGAIAIDCDFDLEALAHAVHMMNGNVGDPNLEAMPIRAESLEALNKARNDYLDAKAGKDDPNIIKMLEAKMRYFAERLDDEINQDYNEFESKVEDADESAAANVTLSQDEVDYVSLLQRGTQKINHSLPSYSIQAKKSQDGKKDLFLCACSVDVGEGEKIFESVAENSKLAKEEAAQQAVDYVGPFANKLCPQPAPKLILEKAKPAPDAVGETLVHLEVDPVGLLNHFAQQRYFDQPTYSFEQSEDRKSWICLANISSFSANGKGTGRTKAEAKSAAASQLLSAIGEILRK
jgi:dsRNA-specific ribonuclease